MRRLWLLLALAACSHGTHGPAWPAASTTGDDGGESIAPREASKVAAATGESAEPDEAKPTAPAATVTDKAPTTDAATPAAAPAPPPTVEDIFINEEITIEIDD